MLKDLFPSVIGQEEAKKKIGFYYHSYKYSRIMVNLLFCAQKGNGKSLLAKETGKLLEVFDDNGKVVMKEDGITPKKKTFVSVTGSDFKSSRQLVSFLLDNVVDKNATVFIDEAHGLKEDVTEKLLILLNPNPENRNTLTFDDQVIDIDFRKQTFIFATSESHLLFVPLMDRLKRIDLQAYTLNHLAKIIKKSSPEVQYDEAVLEDISSVVRSNARQAVTMASDIRTYLCGGSTFGLKQWNELKEILSIKPLGLSPTEISILQFLSQRRGGSSLTNLAAKTGLSRDALQRDYESELQKHSLMDIQAGKGRVITEKGIQYLKCLNPS